jgi:putative acetyltransferase
MIIYRKATKEDFDSIKKLYKATASQKNGIARTSEEITDDYISKVLFNSINNGLIMVADSENMLVGAINAFFPEPICFSHVLSDITFVVHPDFQGKGIGKSLFNAFMQEIELNLPEVNRIELFVRNSNEKAQKLYESFGFQKEGILRQRIKNADGIIENDIIMGWVKQ